MSYPYNPELTVSDQLSKIDLFNPALRPMVAMLVKSQRATARSWTSPAGVSLRMETYGGVECFVLEPSKEGKHPLMVYCHGGAFLLPVQPSTLRLAAHYAAALGMQVVVPEYRLLPSYPVPAAQNDILGVCEAVCPTLLYGESAGGALAACVAPKLGGLRGLMLVYPVLDDRETGYLSKNLYPDAPWPLRSNRAMWKEYLGVISDPGQLVPMKLESLSVFPSTHVEAEEIDLLRDEALRFAQLLLDNGVAVTTSVNSGAYHGFDTQFDCPYVQRVLAQRVTALKQLGGLKL